MTKHHWYIIVISLYISIFTINGQNKKNYINPMKHAVSLSGNFGELRPDHFHAGIDFRTEGAVNKSIISIADGYISRVSIEPSGYGKKLHIVHPATGETSVYAHLNGFASPIDEVVRAYQYKNWTFSVDIQFKADSFPVKQGEVVAYSGNTGSSNGPHLHFELHDTESGDFIDPLFYGFGATDNIPPKFFALRIYPQKNKGSLNGSQKNRTYILTTNDKGETNFAKPTSIKAWGKIGLAVRALDYMNNTNHIFGIRSIKLEVDEKEISHYRNVRFKQSDSRYLNSVIDYEEFCKSKKHYVKSFVDEGNLSDLYEIAVNRGFVIISEERDYHIKYILTDDFGNQSTFSFVIRGEKMKFPPSEKCLCRMPFNVANRFETEDVSLSIPKNTLYNDICFDYKRLDTTGFYSNMHRLHYSSTPLHNFCEISISLTKEDMKDSSRLYAERTDDYGKTQIYVGKYENRTFNFRTRDFGFFVVKADTVPPKITPLNIVATKQKPYISFKISDDLTGIGSYNGYINDEWVLFEYDMKSARIRYDLTEKDIKRNKQHHLKLIVKDKVGNESIFERKFYW